ncbi:MAG: hypothetical protein GW823_06500 [Bacteroidetes bacterium]|nr:hypothetical protein [Bacteroidota bacterium]
MSETSYRNLLKKASYIVKYGRLRSLIIAVVALLLFVLGLVQIRFELMIMAGLLLIIASLYYSLYQFSKQMFSTIEEITKQFSGMNDIPE